MRVTLGIHCCPSLQEVYQKGPSWPKKDVNIIFPALVWMALDFFIVVTLDASTGDFVVSILVRSDDTKTLLQPPLVPGTHSLPWHSAAGSWSPSIQSRPLSLQLCHFWSPKKKALRANYSPLRQAPRILRDRHSPPFFLFYLFISNRILPLEYIAVYLN